MKLIVSGATGLVGSEVIKQSLLHPRVTSVLALTRRPLAIPSILNADVSKLNSVVLEDFTKYPEDVKAQLADADACIWTLAITPTKSKSYPFEEVTKVCKEYCYAGLDAIAEARGDRKARFRFVYMSGDGCPRDPEAAHWFMPDYMRLRGSVERHVLQFADERKDKGWEACVAKPGLISRPGELRNVGIALFGLFGPTIGLPECAAAMIEQTLNGFEKEPLNNVDLVRLGKKALAEEKAKA